MLTLQDATQIAKNSIANVLGNARTQSALEKGYTLKFEQRASTNGGTYFNILIHDESGKKVGKTVEVGNYNPGRARAWFGFFDNIIINNIVRVINDDIVRKLDADKAPAFDITFDIIEAPAKDEAPASAPVANVAF